MRIVLMFKNSTLIVLKIVSWNTLQKYQFQHTIINNQLLIYHVLLQLLIIIINNITLFIEKCT